MTSSPSTPSPSSPERAAPFASWGPPGTAPPLGRRARAFLTEVLGAPGPVRHALPLGEAAARVVPSRLAPDAREALVRAVGSRHVRDDAPARARRAAGLSYLDLLRLRAGDVTSAPDAVVAPGRHDEVRAVLDVCVEAGVAVVPVGGGTSVVGGVTPGRGGHRAVVALDLGRMTRVHHVDPVARTATVEPGLTGPALEEALAPYGLTLGHLPQSYTRATVGGWVATRSAGQASTGYGRIEDMVTSLRLAAPAGDLALGHAPASAAGPDLRHLVLGSEGALGVVTEVGLRLRAVPEARRYEAWVLPGFGTGWEALRALAQDRLAPDVARLSDAAETRATLALSGPGGPAGRLARGYLRLRGGEEACLAVLGWEGTAAGVRVRRRAARAVLRRAGGRPLGRGPAESWRRHRFDGPHLRDTLLDEGVCVETLETAASWSRLAETYQAVRTALRESLSWQGTPPLVGCHVSHVYETGASLYLTVLARQRGGDERAQWQQAKTAATEALVAAGATVTHHHAVGRDHRAYLETEVGALGVDVLRAAKRVLDPSAICNPGVLLP